MPGPRYSWWGASAAMPRQSAPDLSLRLARAITLTRGPRSHLVTLMDAAILIRDLEALPASAAGVGPRGRDDPARWHDQEARRRCRSDPANARGARARELVEADRVMPTRLVPSIHETKRGD